MKKIIIGLLMVRGLFASLPTTTVWEVEIGASDSNAGCFDSSKVGTGTDYSQQAGAQYSFADLVIGATTTNVTSVSHVFVTADIGNCMFISAGSGFTVGRYEITALNGAAAVLDRSVGTATSSGGTWVEGGALLTVGLADSSTVGGNIVFVKYNATPFGITTATAGSGGPLSASTAMIFQSYATTRTVPNADANRAIIQNQASTITAASGSGTLSIGFVFDGNSQTAAKWTTGGSFYRVTVKNYNTVGTGSPICVDCLFTANSAATAVGYCVNCEFTGNTSTPANLAMGVNILSHDNTGASTDGFSQTLNSVLVNASAYNNGRDGFNTTSGGADLLIVNADSESNARYGFGFTAGTGARLIDYYAGFGNSTALVDNAVGTLSQGTTFSLGASAFVAPGSGNFALNNTAGAGALLRNAAFPNVFPNGTTSTFLDVGAARHQDPSGGSGVTVGYPIH